MTYSTAPPTRACPGAARPTISVVRMARALALGAAQLAWLPSAQAAVLRVPAIYPTVQAAVNAASPGDTIRLAGGAHPGPVRIDKDLNLIGDGRPVSTIYAHVGDGAVMAIDRATVALVNIEIIGGRLVSPGSFAPGSELPGIYAGESSRGIDATAARLKLRGVMVNHVVNHLVTITNGRLEADDLRLKFGRADYGQADVGIRIRGSTARLRGLRQMSSTVDHTVDINQPERDEAAPAWGQSDVEVMQSTVVSSALSWGDCFRAFSDVSLSLDGVSCTRRPGGEAPQYDNHTAVSVNGPQVDVRISRCKFRDVPVGISFFGDIGQRNTLSVERSLFEGHDRGAVLIRSLRYSGVDLGGGRFGSAGLNVFGAMAGVAVRLDSSSNADVPAYDNVWTGDPERSIRDRSDDPSLGKVLWQR